MRWGGGVQLEIDLYKSRGLPIGNLTSQIFANIYLNELDQFVKHELRIKHYFRYADDFAIVHNDTKYLAMIKDKIEGFLGGKLNLALHPDKVEIRKFTQGVDFLGYVILSRYIVLRTRTKKRMLRKLNQKQNLFLNGELSAESYFQTLQSYLGLLEHCDGHELSQLVENSFYPIRL